MQCVGKKDCVCKKVAPTWDIITQDQEKVGSMVEIQGVTQVM